MPTSASRALAPQHASLNPPRFGTPPTAPRVYINQNLEPVAMDERDAHDEVSRLSETLGKATLLPTPPTRGAPGGLIASWGAVSLQPLDPARTAELAAGTGDQPGVLVDTIGNPQRSAQLDLPIYRLGGGAGYVWSASWNGRGRGTLRMLAIDASRLPGAVAEANPAADPPAIVSAPSLPTVVTAAPTSPPPDGSKAAVAPQPVPSVVAPSARKSVEPAPLAAPGSKAPAETGSPPTDVRVVGPPIALQPAASAATPTPSSSSSASGSGLIISIALIAVLVGALGYLFKKRRGAMSPAVAATPAAATSHELPVPQKMDLTALVPAGSLCQRRWSRYHDGRATNRRSDGRQRDGQAPGERYFFRALRAARRMGKAYCIGGLRCANPPYEL